jgi:nitrate reductase gamma subunit
MLFLGHLIGLLTPIQVFESVGISHSFKQSMANVIGGTAGTVAFLGLLLLLRSRLSESRGRLTSMFGDVAILLLILVQIGLGLSTIPVALAKMSNGCEALPLMWWAQSIATLKPDAAVGYIAATPLIFKLHIFNGLTIALVFPFTRLVNVWGVPAWFLTRRRGALRQAPSAAR